MKTKPILAVSFYTKDTPYVALANRLEASLKNCQLPYLIEGVDSLGDWYKNTTFKATFLQRVCEKHGNKFDILWIDADAIVRQDPRPVLERTDCDLGAVFRKGQELLTGTLLLRHNDRTHQLFGLWKAQCALRPRVWEQKNLQAVLNKVEGLKVVALPPSLTYIFDISKVEHPDTEPIIEHYQASRQCRRMRL
jgi:hypothetical protein